MSRFDILLVLGYFRSATAYLSIIRHLSPGLRIGVLTTATERSLHRKTGRTEALFLQLCRDFGAEVLTGASPLSARLMIVQQFPYGDEQVRTIDSLVVADRRVGLMALAMAGVEPFDRFIDQFGIEKLYAPSRRLMAFLVEHRLASERYRTIDVEEVGLPFGAHPVFTDFGVDWLIAAPTLFSFSTEAGKQAFLRDVLALFSQIPSSDVVAYKPHNGNQRDYFVPRLNYAVASLFRLIPGGERLLGILAHTGPSASRRVFSRTLTSALHSRVLGRAVPMSQLTPYGDISLEAFLPGVRKGVIGGLSNTIWGTLYFSLPFFNCADPSLATHQPSELLNKNSEMLLKLNLEYFGVPYCAGDLTRGASGEDIVSDEDRQGDLLRAIQRDLSVAR